MINKTSIAPKLIQWYLSYKRDLPWRHTNNPYFIWISEIILQQTRVNQGLPYYWSFVEKFPTVFDLAQANEQEVLRLWQGLGYYSRARNMHKTAKMIVDTYNGHFPSTYNSLLKLKGIGPYTAAAIASFAFKERVAVLDGNVFRVLARLFGIETDIASSKAKGIFTSLANELISNEYPDLYNQAIMEFGALHCTPSTPNCMFCPFNNECVAFLTGKQQVLPIKSKQIKSKNRYFHYLLFTYGNEIAMKERTQKDIWNGLYDFYLIEQNEFLSTYDLMRLPELTLTLPHLLFEKESATYTHILSHQKVFAKFWHFKIPDDIAIKEHAFLANLTFFDITEIHHLPKPILIANYLNQHFF